MESSNLPCDLLASGADVVFMGAALPEDTVLQADWIADAVKNGKRVSVTNAIILGPLKLRYGQFAEEFSLVRCTFREAADFTFSHFARNLNLSGSVFEKIADFRGATLSCDGILSRVKFRSLASFVNFAVKGRFDARETTFQSDALFTRSQMSGACEFGSATFQGNVSFNTAVLLGGISFHDEASITSTQFIKIADFMHSKMASANFQWVIFRGRALFTASEIGRAIFRGATFLKGSDPSFRGARFSGEALFQGTVFADKVSFIACYFGNVANFDREQRGHDGLCFLGARFTDVTFDYARFEAVARFEHAIFAGVASFRETVFRVAAFSETGLVGKTDQFQGSLDLLGCTYERIETSWQRLSMYFAGLKDLSHFDRQPYLQLEAAYRKSGKDDEADAIYLLRKRVERKRNFKRRQVGVWLGSWLYNAVANYGIRPYRLALVSVLLIIAGAFLFSLPNAAHLKPEHHEDSHVPPNNKRPTATASTSGTDEYSPLSFGFRLSLRTFLPVELPLLADWEPSDRSLFGPVRISDCAALLKISGWILVPLGVAALTGLLRVKTKAPGD